MTVEQATKTHLLTVAAVTAFVSTRIYQLILPQKAVLPALRLQMVDEPQGYHLRGPDGATRARIQIDAYGSGSVADPYGAVLSVADAVDAALSGQVFDAEGLQITGVLRNSRRVGYESDELRLVRCMQDFTVWWKAL